MEQDYLLEDWSPLKGLAGLKNPGETDAQALERLIWGPDLDGHKLNRRLYAALLRAGIDVKADLNPAIFHQKFIVRDAKGPAGKHPKPAVLAGSTNFTDTDTHTNLNHVVIFHHRGIVQEYYCSSTSARTSVSNRYPLRLQPIGLPPV